MEMEKSFKIIEIFNLSKSPLSQMYLEIIDMELLLFQEKYKQGLQQAMMLTERYRRGPSLFGGRIFYTLIIAHYFEKTSLQDKLADTVIDLAEQALKVLLLSRPYCILQ